MIRPGTVTVMTVVQPDDRRRLAALAAAQGQAVSRLIRDAIDRYLAEQGLPALEPIQRHGGHRTADPTA